MKTYKIDHKVLGSIEFQAKNMATALKIAKLFKSRVLVLS